MDPDENAEGYGRSPSLKLWIAPVFAGHSMTPDAPWECAAEEIDEGSVFADLETSSEDDDMCTPNSNDTDPAGVGLANLEGTCYMNSVLQCLIHTVPLFRSIIAPDKRDSWKCTCVANPEGFCLVCNLRQLFQSSTMGSGYVSPFILVKNLSYISKSFRKDKQDDAHEYLTAIRTRLMEWHKEPSDDEANFIRRLFRVRTVSMLTCTGCDHSTTRARDLFDIALPVDEWDSLSMALESYMEVIGVEYTCEMCGAAAGAIQETNMTLFPLIVTFLLKRFDDKGKKVEKEVSFPLELDLSDYAETQSGQHKYVLYAIIVHQGNRTISGHYLTFVRLSTNKWSRFNDELVSKVSEDEVLSQEAYILFYVKEGTDWFSDAIVPYADNPITTNPKGCKFKETADMEVSEPSSSEGDGSLNEKFSRKKWMESNIDILSEMYTPNSNDTDPAGVGLENLGSTCYVNSVLQCLIHTVPLFRSIIVSDQGNSWKCTRIANPEGLCLVCSLRQLFRMSTMGKGFGSPVKLVKNLSYFNERFRKDKEDDAHEFLTAIRSRLMEWHKEPLHDDANFIRRLFRVRTVHKLTCKACDDHTYHPEDLFEIGLPIHDSESLSMALQSYMGEVEVEYNCGRCRVAGKATMETKMTRFPSIFTFLLKRFDNNGNKVEKDVSFPMELDLTEYAGKKLGSHKYVLYAIIVHEGEKGINGHYLTFARLTADKWVSCDDELVSKVSEKEVLNQKAYILFYAKKETAWFEDAIGPYGKKNHGVFLPF